MNKHAIPTLAAIGAAATLLSGCQTVPPRSAALDEARAAVAALRGDPNVVRAAPVQLNEAEAALRRAQDAWQAGRTEPDLRHLAYLAVQRAAIARDIAASRVADARFQEANAEFKRLQAQRTVRILGAQEQAAQAQAESERARQAERNEALRRQLELLQGRSTVRGMTLTLADMHFNAGRAATLRGSGERIVGRLADVLREHPERRVRVEGYTDNVGSPDINLDLSRRRAEAFRQALIRRGIALGRIEVAGLGEGWPLAENATASGRLQNRRVEVLFSDVHGQFPPR